jgi:hypothetical protein
MDRSWRCWPISPLASNPIARTLSRPAGILLARGDCCSDWMAYPTGFRLSTAVGRLARIRTRMLFCDVGLVLVAGDPAVPERCAMASVVHAFVFVSWDSAGRRTRGIPSVSGWCSLPFICVRATDFRHVTARGSSSCRRTHVGNRHDRISDPSDPHHNPATLASGSGSPA